MSKWRLFAKMPLVGVPIFVENLTTREHAA